MEEIWKPIKDYEGCYEASNLGRIRSLDRWVSNGKGIRLAKGKVLHPTPKHHNYLTVLLSKDGVKKRRHVHRLVAQAFIPNPDDLPQINHKDENPINNCVDNLEWCTAKYNNNYGNHKRNWKKAYERSISNGEIK